MILRKLAPTVSRGLDNVTELAIGVPRYITIDKRTCLIFKNTYVDFYSKSYYEIGKWKFILKQHGDGFYLEKERLHE